MTLQLHASAYLMLLAGVVSLVFAVFSWRRRTAPGGWPLVLINIAGAIWAWTTAFELASTSFETALVFHGLSFVGMDALGVAFFAFAAQYTGRDAWITPRRLALLLLVPAVTQVLVWTNARHGLIYTSVSLPGGGGFGGLEKTAGLWWWVDTAYSYALIAAGVVVLTSLFLRAFGLYRRQALALTAAALVPIAADSLYTYGLVGSEDVNLAPASFAWVGLVLYLGFTRYHLMDATPVAREFVVEHMADCLVVTDTRDRVTYLNRAAEKLLARDLGSAAGRPLVEVLEESPDLLRVYQRAKSESADGLYEWQHVGEFYDAKVSGLMDGRGRARGHVMVLRDTTAHKLTEMALEDARHQLEHRVRRRTAELAAEKERLARLNTVAVEIARCSSSTEVLRSGVRLAREAIGCDGAATWGRSRSGRYRVLENDGLHAEARRRLQRLLAASAAVREAIATGKPVVVGGPEPHASADDAWDVPFTRVVVVPLVSRGHNLGALCLVDADRGFGSDSETLSLAQAVASQLAVALESAHRFEDAQFLAERDSLTRLLNHRGISRRLEEEVARCERSGATFGLVMIDVDNFKLINDAYGHAMGDRALQEIARVLDSSLRRSDAIARYGGDEFIAVLPDASVETSVQLVERIRATLGDSPFDSGNGRGVPIKMSYGVVTYPRDGRSVAELLAAVDANLYRSKQRGGDFITASTHDDPLQPTTMGSFSVLDGLVNAVDKKDHYTRRHSDDVTELAVALAAKMGLSHETRRSVRVAGLLHDIGKVGVPDHILRKPADLNDEEREIVRNHVTLGELIIQGIPNQEEVVGAVGSHHERFDGKGYPRGLRGTDIPLLGRILCVADAYSAMTTDRPYRKALPAEEARAELGRSAGTQLDPELVTAFLEMLEQEAMPDGMQTALAAAWRP